MKKNKKLFVSLGIASILMFSSVLGANINRNNAMLSAEGTTITNIKEAKAAPDGTKLSNVKAIVADICGKEVFITDPDGTGINYYDDSQDGKYRDHFKKGDNIIIKNGEMATLGTKRQINNKVANEIVLDATSNAVLAPDVMTYAEAAKSLDKIENNYVTVGPLKYTGLKNSGGTGNEKTNYYFTDGKDDLSLYTKHVFPVYNNVLKAFGEKAVKNNFYYITTAVGISKAKPNLKTCNNMEIVDQTTGEAYKFSRTLLDLTSEDCAAKNVTKDTWTKVEAAYTGLAQAAKDLFVATKANEKGSIIQQAAARYDACITGHPDLDDFAHRTTTAASNAMSFNNDSTIVIVSVSVLTVALLGAAVLLMKRRKVSE